MQQTLALTLGLLLTALQPLRASAQEPRDLERALDERIQAVEALPATGIGAGIWREAEALVRSAAEGASGAVERLIETRLSRPGLSQRAELLLVGARLARPEPDRAALSEKLLALLAAEDDEIGQAAAALLSDRTFQELRGDEADAVVKRLTEAARDGARPPEYRLECAVALHAQGRAEGQRAARKEMTDFLSSADSRLKSLGALALARVGDVETGRAELQSLAALPGPDGILAGAYLKQEDLRRHHETNEKKLLEYAKKQAEEADLKGSHECQLLERVMRMVETTSLEGDKHSREDLIDSALDGMLHSLDEHSSYMPPKSFKTFDQDLLQAEYGGIGAYVGEGDDHLFTIRQPIYSGPAYRAGLHSEDKIVRIGDWPTVGPNGTKPVDEIIKRLKGKPGTKVRLYVWRHGMDGALIERPTEEMAIEVVREEIKIPPVKALMLPGGIALVQLSTFSRVASDELSAKLALLRQQGLRAVILDLRNNTGGLLTEAQEVANLFLPKGKLVVTTESRIDDPEKLFTRADPLVPPEIPVAVLINGTSASASEIVAGALQDHGRAVLVGQQSFGKASVQQLLPVQGEPDDRYEDENKNNRYDPWEKLVKDWNGNGEFDFGPRVRLTIAGYLLPSGRSVHRVIDDEGKVTREGGIQPELEEESRRFEPWQVAEFRRLNKERRVREYVDQRYAGNRELFLRLSEGDEDDLSRYPDFDAFYNSLGTTLTTQDVRLLVRTEIRGRVQDDRGAAFPDGDFQEDRQLQRAIAAVLEKLGGGYEQIPAYATTFENLDAAGARSSSLLAGRISDTARSGLRHALALIAEAKSGAERLSPERLDELERAVQAALDK